MASSNEVSLFRKLLQNYAEQHCHEILIEEMKTSDELCRRFLKARAYDLDNAVIMFKQASEYRQENKLDNILLMPFPQFSVIRANYICGWHKTDRNGHPIYFDLVGKLNLDQLEKKSSIHDMMFSHHHANEFLHRIINPKLYESLDVKEPKEPQHHAVPGKIMSIIDLKGLSRKLVCQKIIGFVQSTSKADQLLFPEMLTVCVIINAPFLFKLVWKVIQPFLEERTRKKIIICNDSGISTLEKYVDPQNIPVFFGGKCTTCDGDCVNNSEFTKEYVAYVDTVNKVTAGKE